MACQIYKRSSCAFGAESVSRSWIEAIYMCVGDFGGEMKDGAGSMNIRFSGFLIVDQEQLSPLCF